MKGDPWHQGHDPCASSSNALLGQDPAAADRFQQIEQRLHAGLQDSIRKEISQVAQQMEGRDDDQRADQCQICSS